MPGARLCARCSSSLDLDGVTIEPPRAARHNAATAIRRAGYRLRWWLPNFTRLWSYLGILIPEPIDGRALLWSFLPGLGHLKTGRLLWGRALLSTWIGCFVLMILSVGTNWARFMLAGMVAVHALAIVTLFAANLAFERLPMRAAFGLVVFLTIQFFVYEPCVWFSSRFLVTTPIGHNPSGSPVREGDGLLCEGPWIRPTAFARGDIVLYRVNDFGGHGVIVRAGYGVNRVVGVPGDRIARMNGVLTVNGERPGESYVPLGRLPALGDFDFSLGRREYAVFTAVERAGVVPFPVSQVFTETLVRQLSVVSHDDVMGRVILRLRPFSRFGRIG